MKLTDFIINSLVEQGVTHIFGVTGGAIVHLFDSAAKNPDLKPIFTHHEQSAAFAAEAYAKVKGNLGVVFTTTGPGATNALTGLAAAWLDSIPCLFISGQARLDHTTHRKPIRQRGTQQLDIIPIVKPMTKYAVMIERAEDIQYHLQKALFLAKTGRPGPVWIDLPLNFQWSQINPDTLPRFEPSLEETQKGLAVPIEECVRLLTKASRPLILAGFGVRLAHAEEELERFIEQHKIPFVTTWGASDLLPTDHDLYVGRPGIAGQRGANLAIQNCDLLLAIGTHLPIPVTGARFEAFAREAKIIAVDIDPLEFEYKTVRIDLPISCDAKTFLLMLQKETPHLKNLEAWHHYCEHYRNYNLVPEEWKRQKKLVNHYWFLNNLSEELQENDVIVVDGGGTNVYISYQALRLKKNQRLILSSGLCSMGSGLPESIGACMAHNRGRVICLCGDGSFQLNVQELQTIAHHRLPIKIFVFNNDGYISIRDTQGQFLNGNFIGSDREGGISWPPVCRVAEAYGFPTFQIRNHEELPAKIREVLSSSGPTLCEVMVPRDQAVIPRQGFDEKADETFAVRPLEDMAPYLDREEFRKMMIVKPLNGS